jgi:hypothetical protein
MNAGPALSDEVEAVVRAVPGVVSIYPAGPLISVVMQIGAQALGIGEGASPVVVDEHDESVRVTLSLGIHASAGASGTARAVTDAITGLLAARGVRHPVIRLTVAHIAETESVAGEGRSGAAHENLSQ